MDLLEVDSILSALLKRKAAPDDSRRIVDLAADLRSVYYPKQRAYFTSKAKRKATKKTRRSGATTGGCRELIARAIEQSKFRATYVASTRIEAKARAWESDTQSGFVDVVRKFGKLVLQPGVETWDLAGVLVSIRSNDLVLEFSNGSQIDLFGADEELALNKLRGLAKHVFWVDEAQDFRHLARLYKAVITGAMVDFAGECWLTGTPGRDCAGMFYEVTRDDGKPAKGWEVHRIAAIDNPFFGRLVWEDGKWFIEDNLYDVTGSDRSTHPWSDTISEDAHRWGPWATEEEAEAYAVKVRWERTAGTAIRENGWSEDDPDLLREWFARWVKEDARYVYALHSVPEHEIIYAPSRLAGDGFPDIKLAMDDLPGYRDGIEYFVACGADLGTRAAFAFVIWAWSLTDPILYEVCSWKKSGLDYDEMAACLHAARGQVGISLITADAGGGGKPAVMGWSKKWISRYNLPIVEAHKQNKRVFQNQMNTDIRKRFLRMREESPLLVEWRLHRWKPLRTSEGKEVEDDTPHDLCDAGLYGHRESWHHRYREVPKEPSPGTPEHMLREERELEDVAIDLHYER